MDDLSKFGSTRFEDIARTVRRKRSQTSRRPKPEPQLPSSSTPSDDTVKVSSNEIAAYDDYSERKVFNLNQCASRSSSVTGVEGEDARTTYSNGSREEGTERGRSGLILKQSNESVPAHSRHTGVSADGVVSENKLRKVKLKVGGVTRTIQTKAHVSLESGSASTNVRLAEAPQPRQKIILQVYDPSNCFFDAFNFEKQIKFSH